MCYPELKTLTVYCANGDKWPIKYLNPGFPDMLSEMWEEQGKANDYWYRIEL